MNNPFRIRKKRDYLKMILIIIAVAIMSVSPLIIAFGYQWIMEMNGEVVNEANSALFSVFWFAFLTIPGGAISILLLIGITIFDTIRLFRKKVVDQHEIE